MKLDSSSARLAVVPAMGPLRGERVGVSVTVARGAATGVLQANPGQSLGQSVAVRLVGLEEIPDDVLVVPDALAGLLGLSETGRIAWALRTEGFVRQRAQEVELELTVERPLEQLVDELGRNGGLLDRVLWARGGATAGDLWLEAAGETFRVRQLKPAPTGGEVIYEIGPETRFNLFASALRASVDVVILADCSGSMSWADIQDRADVMPAVPAPAPTAKRSFFSSLFGSRSETRAPVAASMTRIEALKRALDSLLAVRLRTPGRVSRIALVAFTERCEPRFPRSGGMVEMDENSPPELVQQFRDAIGLLRPENAGTNIGNALNHAAELLDKHGRPGNDRLIVLISDGADWKPQSSDDAGEVVRGVDEPVSLMEDLNERMRISLHALGISNEAIFEAWWKQHHPYQTAHPSAVPNHKLLEALVVVGGGDPTRTGDAEVLADYFSGLGRGVSRRLSISGRSAPPARLSDQDRTRLRQHIAARTRSQAATDSQSRRTQLCEEILSLFRAANEYGKSLAGQDVFRVSTESILILHQLMFEPVRSKREFDWWWGKLHQQFLECRDVRIWDPDKTYPVDGIKNLLHGPETAALNHLRNWCSHHWSAPGDDKEGKSFERSLQRVREILQRLIGRVLLEDDDEEGWIALQMAVLERLRTLLASVVDVFRQVQQVPQVPQVQRPLTPAALPRPSRPAFLYIG